METSVCLYNDVGDMLRLAEITSNFNRLCPSIKFRQGNHSFSLSDSVISLPTSYGQIPDEINTETKSDTHVLFFTNKPYDNNYFFEGDRKRAIVSLSDWGNLTTLSRNNGVVYFICAILVRRLNVGVLHEYKITGCVNDFWQDKTEVDIGMRSAFICPECLRTSKGLDKSAASQLKEVQGVLNDISSASRANMDVCDYWSSRVNSFDFDVFMCHNSLDKVQVRIINKKLRQARIKTWLDEAQLPPGKPWQPMLEKQIGSIRCVAVFVGESGIGPWEDMETRAFISEFVERGCSIIPVILPDCTNVPKLPIFLKQFMWVDLRQEVPNPYRQLKWGITGKKPSS